MDIQVVTEDGFVEVMSNTDEEHSNWMIFVRPAQTPREQNLIAYQEDGCIFFVSLRVSHSFDGFVFRLYFKFLKSQGLKVNFKHVFFNDTG